MSVEAYLAWRRGTDSTHAFWERKLRLSREALASISASVAVCEHNQLWNQRFCLLVLLRAKAAGELG